MSDVRAYAPGGTGTLADVVEQGPELKQSRPAGPDSFAPPPSWSQLFTAARPEALRSTPLYDDVKIGDGYAPIVDALGLPASENPGYFGDLDAAGQARFGSAGSPSRLATSARQGERIPFGAQYLADRSLQESLILDQIHVRRAADPKWGPGIPDTVDGLHQYFEQQQAQKRAAGASVLARGTTFGRVTAGIAAGGLESALHDPITLPTLVLGGGTASSLVQAAGRDALINGVLAAAEQPIVAHNMAENDEHLTAGDVVSSVVSSAAFGGVFGATVHGIATHVPPALFHIMPASVQTRWAARMKVGPGKDAPLLKDVLGDMDNRELATFARSSIGAARMTPDEKAAAAVIERNQEIGEASPFEPGPAGDAAHAANLGDALQSIIDGVSRESPKADLLVSSSPVALRSPGPVAVPGHAGFESEWSAIKGNEHGIGRHGEFLTSPAGAIGPAQVMPGTAPHAAQLAGLPFDDHLYRTDAAYNEKLGRAYYAEQLQTFGDPAMAAAAYNAGPGSAAKGTGLRGALRRAAEHGEPGNWEAYLPHETQRYVADFRKRMGLPDSGAARAVSGVADDDALAALQRSADQAEAEGLALSSARGEGLDADVSGDRAAVADVPVLKREMFPSENDWAEAQAAFHRSVNAPEASPRSGASASVEAKPALGPVVYHGTNRSFDRFEPQSAMRRGEYGEAFEVHPQAHFFSENADTAAMFARDRSRIDAEIRGLDAGVPRVGAFRLAIEQPLDLVIDQHALREIHEAGFENWMDTSSPNPLVAEEIGFISGYGDGPETWTDVQRMLDDPRAVERLRAEGYDAVRLREDDGSVSWAVFDPDKIVPAALAEAADVKLDDPALKAFDDGGSGRVEQTDSLEHDLRLAAAEPATAKRTYSPFGDDRQLTLTELFEALDRERDGVAALRACAGVA